MTAPLDAAVRSLLMSFRRRRPVRAGSLLITLLGDSIAPRGGKITLASLIRLAQPFGLTDRLVRTSVGRLARDGWLLFERAGRQSEYALTAHGKHRFAEATRRIYGTTPSSWDGQWTLLLLASVPPALRERVRDEMRWLGFGQLSAGVLAHPTRTLGATRDELAELGVNGAGVVMRARSEGRRADRQLVAAGWDLAELARSYRRFVAGFEPVLRALMSRQPAPETAFLIRTLLVHEYRKIHLRDPLLPHPLLPQDWIGADADSLCRDLYRKVFARAERYLSAHATTLAGQLAHLSNDGFRRFGGLSGR